MTWKLFPVIRVLLPFVVGIICQHYFLFSFLSLSIFAGIILVSLFIKKALFIFFNLCFVLFGCLSVELTHQKEIDLLLHQKHEYHTFYFSSPPELKGKWYKGVADLGCLSISEKHKIQVMWKASLGSVPKSNAIYMTENNMSKLPQSIEWNRFDYTAYLKSKGIQAQLFISQKPPVFIQSIEGWNVSLRSKLIDFQQQFVASISDEKVRGVLVGLLFGDKQWLEKEVKTSFQKAGAIHVLAVSGLHVGILYLLLGFLLRIPRSTYKNIPFWKTITILLLLWGYALLTGFGSSVVRAVLMFSFVQAGRSFSRPIHPLNSLFWAAFCMLIVNPNSLFDLGFQLSFSAVIGLVTALQFF